MKVKAGALLALVAALCVGPASAQAPAGEPPPGGPIPPAGTIRIPDLDTKLRGPVRPVDLASYPANAFLSNFIAGPASGLDSAYLILARSPPGGAGPALHTHPVDQFYFTVQGRMTIQIGTDVFSLQPETFVFVPAGTPHRSWNTSSTEEEVHVEVMAPPPPRNALTVAAEPRKVADAESLIHRVADAPGVRASRGIEYRWLLGPRGGSAGASFRYDETHPGAARQGPHIHAFDQVFFVIDGTMHLQVGTKDYEVGPLSYVVLPAGTVHQQWATGSKPAKHLDIQLPAPAEGDAFDIPVQFGPAMGRRKGSQE